MMPFIILAFILVFAIGISITLWNEYKLLENPYRVVLTGEGSYLVQKYTEIDLGYGDDYRRRKTKWEWQTFYSTTDETDAIVHYKMALKEYKENKQQKEIESKKDSLEKEIQEQKNKIVKTLKIKD